MICVCKGGKWKYISLGIAINPKFWYFEKNRHKHNSSNREQILKVINEQEQKYYNLPQSKEIIRLQLWLKQ